MNTILIRCLASLLFTATPSMARVALPLYDASTLSKACDSALGDAQKRVAGIEAMPRHAKTDKVLPRWNDLQVGLADVLGPAYLFAAVHPDDKVRSAGEACTLKYNVFNTELLQNEKLYRRIVGLKPTHAIDKKLRQDLLEDFEDGGVSLPPQKRERAKQISKKLEELRQEFDRNIRDNKTRLSFTAKEMKGLPAAYLEKAQRDGEGNYLLGFDYPDYLPFMTNADDEAARQRYYIAFANRGTARNLELMKEIALLRKELAGLHGLPSYSEYVARRLMSGSAANVRNFLDEVKAAVNQGEAREVAQLRALKAQQAAAEDVRLNRWDTLYYQEKIRKARYNIDQEALRKYFPMPAAVDYALLISSELYGVKFQRAEVPVWHQEVVYYDVLDTSSGKYLAGIYLDLYPRDGKYKHAAAFPVRGGSTLAKRTPVSVLVTNFNRDGLNHREMETLLHEFGHVLHGVLSTAKYENHAGTSVERDFVEAPSQMFEEWARRPAALMLFRQVCASCPPLDPDLIKRLDDARKYGSGLSYSRQHHLAVFDQAMTGDNPGDPLETWNRMEAVTPLGSVPGTLGPSAFAHNTAHYGARYYGYMWSEVLALDMLSVFGDNLMNPAVGRRFRATILANGGQAKAKEMVRRFLGREPNSKAFFDEITGKR